MNYFCIFRIKNCHLPLFIITRFIPYSGMALYPFILLKEKKSKHNKIMVHHEKIHLRQQLELLLVFFYLAYVLHYFFNLLKYQNHDKAYREIIFEREAYKMESDLEYLNNRKLWNFKRF